MSQATSEEVEAAAAAIANARCMRRGAPPFSNVLDVLRLLPGKLLDEVMEDAKAAIDAVDELRKGKAGS
jgi:hypothetical protein